MVISPASFCQRGHVSWMEVFRLGYWQSPICFGHGMWMVILQAPFLAAGHVGCSRVPLSLNAATKRRLDISIEIWSVDNHFVSCLVNSRTLSITNYWFISQKKRHKLMRALHGNGKSVGSSPGNGNGDFQNLTTCERRKILEQDQESQMGESPY